MRLCQRDYTNINRHFFKCGLTVMFGGGGKCCNLSNISMYQHHSGSAQPPVS